MANYALKSEEMARKWLNDVSQKNIETEQLIRDIASSLDAIQEGLDSTVVDELALAARNFIQSADRIKDSMLKIHEGINTVVDQAKKVADDLVNIVKGAAKASINKILR